VTTTAKKTTNVRELKSIRDLCAYLIGGGGGKPISVNFWKPFSTVEKLPVCKPSCADRPQVAVATVWRLPDRRLRRRPDPPSSGGCRTTAWRAERGGYNFSTVPSRLIIFCDGCEFSLQPIRMSLPAARLVVFL